MQAFHYQLPAQEVIFEYNAFERLGQAAEQRGWRRLMLCTSPSQRALGRVDRLREQLGGRLAAVFDSVAPHVQDDQLARVLDEALLEQVDAVIGLGGGSPIGMAKAAAHALREHRPAVIAIPTTYAGSEMTPIFGVTHTREQPPRKVTVTDPASAPALVIYDPVLTLDTPPSLTAASGMNALAHCVEALYSLTRHPLSSAAAVSAVERIHRSLPRCVAQPDDLEARSDLLMGAHLAGVSLASARLGLHHGVCHVLGGSAGVPHGIANSIMLPHVVRFNASATAEQLLPAARAMGIDAQDPQDAVGQMAQRVAEMSAGMGLPDRLREVGVEAEDLPRLALLAFENKTVRGNPRPIEGVEELEALLRGAW